MVASSLASRLALTPAARAAANRPGNGLHVGQKRLVCATHDALFVSTVRPAATDGHLRRREQRTLRQSATTACGQRVARGHRASGRAAVAVLLLLLLQCLLQCLQLLLVQRLLVQWLLLLSLQ